MVRIEGALGIGDSLALAVQPASPCRDPQAEERTTMTASGHFSARGA